jgi:hypothetical protein
VLIRVIIFFITKLSFKQKYLDNNKPLLVRFAQDSFEKRIRKAALMVLLAVFLLRMSSRLLERKKFFTLNTSTISLKQKNQMLVDFGKSIPSLFNPLISQQLKPKTEDTSETDALDRVLLDEESSSFTCNIPFTCWFHKHGRIGAPNIRLSSKMLDDLLDNMLQ